MKTLDKYTIYELKVLEDAFWDVWGNATKGEIQDWDLADKMQDGAEKIRAEINNRAISIYDIIK
jgi:hypothetical protein